jgi:hypothetical protein
VSRVHRGDDDAIPFRDMLTDHLAEFHDGRHVVSPSIRISATQPDAEPQEMGLAGGQTGNDTGMGRNVLVVEAVEHAEAAVRARLGDDVDEVRVVVPVVRQGFFDWLANDERAASEAEEEASRLADELPQVVDAHKGEADVMLAIRDALATFDADEILVALHPDEEAQFAERVAAADLQPSVDGVPVRAIVVHDVTR